ncbi:hypothetical protein [Dongia sp.]
MTRFDFDVISDTPPVKSRQPEQLPEQPALPAAEKRNAETSAPPAERAA